METCSICLVEVEFDTLTYIDSGEGLCNDCLDEELNSNALHYDYLDSIRDWIMYTFTYGSPVEHAGHVWEEWHAYLGEYPESATANDSGICCHTCRTIIIER